MKGNIDKSITWWSTFDLDTAHKSSRKLNNQSNLTPIIEEDDLSQEWTIFEGTKTQ